MELHEVNYFMNRVVVQLKVMIMIFQPRVANDLNIFN